MKQKITRVLASLLALVCFGMLFLPLSDVNFFVSQAATFRGKNIWTNGPEAIYGRNRNWMYKWTDGWQMTFCIAPRNHMGSTITAEARRTNIDDDEIPYIKSKEDYEKLAMIVPGMTPMVPFMQIMPPMRLLSRQYGRSWRTGGKAQIPLPAWYPDMCQARTRSGRS